MTVFYNYFYTMSALKALTKIQKYGSKCGKGGSWWSEVKMGPPDAILGLSEAFNKDKESKKVLLGAGAYRDDEGKPFVLSCVRKAEENILCGNYNKEYAPISGDPEFCKMSIELALGHDSGIITNNLYATVQGIAGTGSLSLAATFLKKFFPGNKAIYVPTPTWGNHISIFKACGLEVKKYKYYDPKTGGLDYEGVLDDICKIPDKSMVLFHVCAHNPTGVDPSKEQWCELSQVIKQKHLFTFFDMAYQGFATGNLENDAFPVRKFAEDENKFALTQSYSKNMGLYGERVGAFSLIADSKEEADILVSQMKIIIRALYSNPPLHGARIVKEILKNKELRGQWLEEMKCMSDRIISVRKKLRDNLKKEGSSHNWDHVVNQIGMFCYTKLNPQQVEKITKEHHIYLTKDGRISMAGVTSKNVDYLARAMHLVTK